MRTITYYYARCLDDADCYSIRVKTLREVKARMKDSASTFAPPVKVEVAYRDIMDLIEAATSEGGLYEKPIQ